MVGTTAAARSAPDGYTLVVGGLSNIALNPGLYKELSYDPLVDFTPVGLIATYSYTLVGRKDLPQSTLKELVEYARANPGKINFAVGGPGTGQQIGAAILAKLTGTSFQLRPVQGRRRGVPGPPRGARRPLLRPHRHRPAVHRGRPGEGHRDLVRATESAAAGGADDQRERRRHARDGDLVRSVRAGEDAAADPRAAARETAKVVEHPEVVARFEKATGRVVGMSPEATDTYVKAEIAKWTRLVREAGITAE